MIPYYPNFLNTAEKVVLDNLHENEFRCGHLVQKLGMSRSQVYKNIKKHTSLSTSEFINFIRLEKAKELLETSSLPINDISYKVGVFDPNYFTRLFKKYVGVSPSYYKKQIKRI